MGGVDESRLRAWLSKYHNPEIAFREIQSVASHYQSLSPVQETYIFNDGTPMDLVNLNGTIPVSYKGSTYNIPICIWLIDTHPKNAPICYVKPTSDMAIKPSKFVDQNGKIYLPYLSDWHHLASSDLLGLIQVMIVTFGDEPPVFARAKQSVICNDSGRMTLFFKFIFDFGQKVQEFYFRGRQYFVSKAEDLYLILEMTMNSSNN